MTDIITISLEEYKELLTIKGKYEELKSLYFPYPKATSITYRNFIEEEDCNSIAFDNVNKKQ